MAERLSEIRCKEVINVADGCRLGFAEDFEIDLQEGRLCSVIIPGPCRFFGLFGRQDDYIIPWNRICRMGPDIVLVDIKPEECRCLRGKQGLFF